MEEIRESSVSEQIRDQHLMNSDLEFAEKDTRIAAHQQEFSMGNS